MVQILVDTVDETLFQKLFALYKPARVVAFVSDLNEDIERAKYEKIYPIYKDTITLYSGDKISAIKSYMEKYPDEHFCTVGPDLGLISLR